MTKVKTGSVFALGFVGGIAFLVGCGGGSSNAAVAAAESLWESVGTTLFYNDGPVGIGTDTPQDLLEVKASGAGIGAYIRATNGMGQSWRFVSNGQGDFELNNGDDSDPQIAMHVERGTGYIGLGEHWGPHEEPKSSVQVKGYLQLATVSGVPASEDCNASSEYGRMKVDAQNALLYVCTASGWVGK